MTKKRKATVKVSARRKEQLRRAALKEFERSLERDTKRYKEMLLREFGEKTRKRDGS